eukprot:CAMPEP_0118718596 /NCGR_PEP_ID=MMETSP0800-20121206/28903_1 /TAXON_ID=210618 ORGANISM="Striatella unipunctata, Strain CCMP2910" /NCGR_SAMPLE_ID=MMETSP0800 /ASSEMBLY_ACC=CAM_ASM_000638 /LENGTH=96 /DNA_ID=CAMNT_0006625663 /DNA_START=135 /DNA_END=425 /DNA_ORIENTATION=-
MMMVFPQKEDKENKSKVTPTTNDFLDEHSWWLTDVIDRTQQDKKRSRHYLDEHNNNKYYCSSINDPPSLIGDENDSRHHDKNDSSFSGFSLAVPIF